MEFRGRVIHAGDAEGEALVSSTPLSFFGGVDPDTGCITDRDCEINGRSLAGKVLVFPSGKGSTVGSYTLYQLAVNGKAPCAIINRECETIVAVGCIIGNIPAVDGIPIEEIQSGDWVRVSSDRVTVVRRRCSQGEKDASW